jgi:hypothetical protein
MLAHAGTPDELVGELFLIVAVVLGWIGVSRLRGRSFVHLSKAGAWGLALLALAALASAMVVPSIMRPTPSANRPPSDARLEIVQPTPDEIVRGDSLEVDIRVVGGEITSLSSTNLSSSSGHLHVSIDGQLLSMTSASDTQIDISGLDLGQHTLQAEFVAVDHAPFDPRVVATVSFDKEP